MQEFISVESVSLFFFSNNIIASSTQQTETQRIKVALFVAGDKNQEEHHDNFSPSTFYQENQEERHATFSVRMSLTSSGTSFLFSERERMDTSNGYNQRQYK